MGMKHGLFFLATLLLLMVSPRSNGLVPDNFSSSSSSCSSSFGLVSHGDREVHDQSAFIVLKQQTSSYGCNHTYGFMPCEATVPGDILSVLFYVSLMWFAAKVLYDGSEVLVQFLSPGFAGAVFLPLLSSLLDAIINIASRKCGGGKGTAHSQVSPVIGLLTGSTATMLALLLGGSFIIVDKCNPENSREKSSEEAARGFSLAGSAISTGIRASYTARIMVISAMPFIIARLAQGLHTSSQICFVVFISLIVSVSLLFAYCHYQVFYPLILRRILPHTKQQHMTSRIVKQLKYGLLRRLLTTNGEPDIELIRMLVFVLVSSSFPFIGVTPIEKIVDLTLTDLGLISPDYQCRHSFGYNCRLFENLGENSDQLISDSELRAHNAAAGDLMRDSGVCGDSKINIEAFTEGISKWLNKDRKNSSVCSSGDLKTRLVTKDFDLVSKKDNELQGVERWSAFKAVLMLGLGSLIAATFAVPLVDAVGNFSTATNIPPFFVSFAVLPFASFSEAVSAQILAGRNKLRIASLKCSQIYRAVVSMNNFLCMSVFLSLLYFRQLRWNFTCEMLIVLFIWCFLPKKYG